MTSTPQTLLSQLLPARLAWVVLCLSALLRPAASQADEMRTIQLRNRPAEQVIPVVQPLLQPGDAVTGQGDLLFVRTDAATFRQLQKVIESLDRAPRNLLISVGQGTVTRNAASGARGTATIGSSEVQVGINRPPSAEPGAQIQVEGTRQQANLRNVSSVRALEGNEAWIQIGQSVPVTQTHVGSTAWGGQTVERTTQYRDVATGFYATPRINGDRVVLEITPRQQSVTGPREERVINSSGMTTTVSGRLGEWIEVGAVSEARSGSTRGVLVWGTRSDQSEYAVWVKVDEAN